MSTPTLRANGYAAVCVDCGNWVEVNTGYILKSAAGKWETHHRLPCPPPRVRSAAAKAAANAEPGYYVRPADGVAVVVVQSKGHADRTYGKVLTFHGEGERPTWDYVKGAGYSVADLRPMTAADAAEMGLSHGFCIRCCAPLGGETLSAAVSALVGYGETCAKRMGWPYPKGVVAQRERLARG